MDTRDDLLVQSRFRNLLLWEKMAGKSAAECSKLCGVCQARFGELLNLKKSPFVLLKRGDDKGSTADTYSSAAKRISSFYGMLPEDLFPRSLYELTLPDLVEKTYCSEEILPLLAANKPQLLIGNPELEFETNEMKSRISSVLKTLSPRRESVIRMRYGIGCEPKTLSEIAKIFKVSDSRISQIEASAIRRLKHPTRSKKIVSYY